MTDASLRTARRVGVLTSEPPQAAERSPGSAPAVSLNVAVLGVGYLGLVNAACLAHQGHRIRAFDVDERRLEALRGGRTLISEPELDQLVRDGVEMRRIEAVSNLSDAIQGADVTLVCVGTPQGPDGQADLSDVRYACRAVGEALRDKNEFHVVVMRSTMPPGSTEAVVTPILEEISGKRAGIDFAVGFYPEFLREGSAVRDFLEPKLVVLGATDPRVEQAMRWLVGPTPATVLVEACRTAEAVKYANNAWHATKVVFANEIGNFCKAEGVDGRRVMEVVCADRHLNISAAYLRPGFAYGGSCLPKDLRAIGERAAAHGLDLPMLAGVRRSNDHQIELVRQSVHRVKAKRVTLLGLAFKADTDDLRESPAVRLAEFLMSDGCEVRTYDPRVDPARLSGANLAFARTHLPHLAATHVDDLDEACSFGDILILTARIPDLWAVLPLRPDQMLYDLVGLPPEDRPKGGTYEGACW